MILSDRDIKKAIKDKRIEVSSPKNDHQTNIHAASMDFRLGKYFKLYKHSKLAILDPKKADDFKNVVELIEIPEGEPFILQPGEFILGVTQERVKLGDDLVARVEGRSSLGRLGVIVHSTAGFVDPGFEGTITLEITNINRMPIALYPGMRICQLAFESMTSKAEVPYNKKKSSKYHGQTLPEESRLVKDDELK